MADIDIESPGADESELRDAIRALTRHVTVDISSANILGLRAAPKQLIAAPGAGKYIHLLEYMLEFAFGTAPYADDADIYMLYGDYAVGDYPIPPRRLIVYLGNVFNKSFSTIATANAGVQVQLNDGFFRRSEVENKPLKLFTGSFSEMTGGDGTAKITLYYEIRDFLA